MTAVPQAREGGISRRPSNALERQGTMTEYALCLAHCKATTGPLRTPGKKKQAGGRGDWEAGKGGQGSNVTFINFLSKRAQDRGQERERTQPQTSKSP